MQTCKQGRQRLWQGVDVPLFGLCLAANAYGLVLIFSATRYDPSLSSAFSKQLIASLLGIAAFLLFSCLDMEALTERYAPWMLAFGILLLLLLIPFGNDGGTGNKSWISIPGIPFNLQPAEVSKLIFVLLLARQLLRQEKKGGVSRFVSVLQSAGHALFFCVLLFVISGDMGMVLLYLFLYLIIAWVAGVRARWFLLGLGLFAGLGYLLWPHVPSYIQMRFLVVFDHTLDPLGKGFQQMRSLLTIGSGQVDGQGYLQGVQTQSSASSSLPARHTDFIFSVAGEEFGLLGTLLILALLTALILHCFYVAHLAQSPFRRYVAVGLGGMLAAQSFLNIGMCLFLTPVVGLTLPFFSYGGSSLITAYVAMGILSELHLRTRGTRRRARTFPVSDV